jgi:hypothetical protein
VDYFFSFSPTACRKDPKRRFELFSLKSTDENIPLLPLPEMVTSVEGHPLYPLLKDNDDTSKFLANLMGPGPWTFQLSLTVPNKCGALHFSNKNKRAPIEVSHSLKVVFRAQRGDDQHIDPQSGKPKQFDIMLRMPVHVLSVRHCFFVECLYIDTCGLAASVLYLAFIKRRAHRPPALLRKPGCTISVIYTSGTMCLLRGPWTVCTHCTTMSGSSRCISASRIM